MSAPNHEAADGLAATVGGRRLRLSSASFVLVIMLLKTYLIAYFALLAAALFALWEGRVLSRLPAEWVLLIVVGAVLLGVLLAFVSRNTPPNPA